MMNLSPRYKKIAQLVAKGMPNKAIADTTGLSLRTVETYINQAAERIPGESWPRHKLTIWFLKYGDAA
jgi:DNA-binding NarL/FixJ family response regulator